MKTKEEVLNNFRSNTLDHRDVARLSQFLTETEIEYIGFSLKLDEERKIKEWTEENILRQLEKDVAFGFEKALDQRGISSSMMAEVVLMWNNILENGITEENTPYPMYGLPIFKATALKYNFPNPIGEDTGEEEEYNCE